MRSIWEFSYDNWGESQADKYITQINERINWLAHQPRAGKHRPDICQGYYCFPQGAHLIFYLINDTKSCITIIGIPRQEMDVLDYFDSEE